LEYFSNFAHKLKNPFSSWSLLIFLTYGIFFLWFLFITAHDRSEGEFIERLDFRLPSVMKVWINHGYLKHGGMEFLRPVDQYPDQVVYRSNSMLYMQFSHMLQRIYIWYTGEFSYTLIAVSNQIIVILSSCLLGFLAMRLVLKTGVPFIPAVILGISVQTVYQTFPFSLNYVWRQVMEPAFIIFMLIFLIREEGAFCLKNDFKRNLTSGIMVFFMMLAAPVPAVFFFLAYYFIKIITCPDTPKLWSKIRISFFSLLCAVGIIRAQFLWVKSQYPKLEYQGSSILPRSGWDGDLTYFYDHMDLLSGKFLLNLPNWHPLMFFGVLAIILVITIIQRKGVSFNQQTTLLSIAGIYILYAFLLGQMTVIHPYGKDNFLAIPAILALFALLPAWLETCFSQYKHTFVLLSAVIAFGTAGLQILAYWVHMPPLFFA
jgi:hypothetical protein